MAKSDDELLKTVEELQPHELRAYIEQRANCIVRNTQGDSWDVFKSDEPGHPYPWLFELNVDGEIRHFGGIPNQCATKRAALSRAAWRKKWILEGKFDQHYQCIKLENGK